MNKKIFFISLVILSGKLLAAGGGGGESHASISDLAWPALNATILFVFLGTVLRKALSELFNNTATEIESLYIAAKSKDSEASEKLKSYKDKLANASKEKEEINNNARIDIDAFDKKTIQETSENIDRLRKDVDVKVESEKNGLMKTLQADLVTDIINKTKVRIKSDNNVQKDATKKLAARLS